MIRSLLLFIVLALVPAPVAFADEQGWRQKLGTFRVGIVGGGRPLMERRRAEPFREALEKALGLPVEIVAAADYKTLIEAQIGSRIEYAVYSASAFSAASVLCKCVIPIAVPAATDGSTGFKSVLIARKSAARSLPGLRGRTVLVPGRDSFSGFTFPKDRLAREGIDMAAEGWDIVDTGTMDAAVASFRNGEGDALLGWEGSASDDATSQAGARGTMPLLQDMVGEIEVIWRSPEVPHGPHALRSNLPEEARAFLVPFLLALADENRQAYEAIEPRFAGGFKTIDASSYKMVVDAVRKTVLFSQPADSN